METLPKLSEPKAGSSCSEAKKAVGAAHRIEIKAVGPESVSRAKGPPGHLPLLCPLMSHALASLTSASWALTTEGEMVATGPTSLPPTGKSHGEDPDWLRPGHVANLDQSLCPVSPPGFESLVRCFLL